MSNDQPRTKWVRAGHTFKTTVHGDSVTEIEQTAMAQARDCLGPDADLRISQSFTIEPNMGFAGAPPDKKYRAVVTVLEQIPVPDA